MWLALIELAPFNDLALEPRAARPMPHDAAVQMIDASIVRMHQHGACITRNGRQYALRQTRGPSLYPARIDTAGASR
jgi:hypothetical protein